MAKKLYVGNLSFGCTDDDLRELFEAHGEVESARVVMDREKGRSKGFGFVEMKNEEEAKSAITALNDTEVDGKQIVVKEARPREEHAGPRKNFQRRDDAGPRKGNFGNRRYS